MNFRHTALLFGLCFGMLWLFGLMLAHKKIAVDESFVAPNLQKADDFDFDTVIVQRRLKVKQPDGQLKAQEPEDYTFTRINEYWVWKDKDQAIRVEGGRIKDLVKELKNLRKNDNISINARDLTFYELTNPQVIVTIKGKLKKDNKEKEWTIKVGKDSVDNLVAYVNSSDRPDRVLAVDRAKIESLFFKDANALRSLRLFDFGSDLETGVTLKEGARDLDLAKGEQDGLWRFVKPTLGFADYEGAADPKMPFLPGAKSETGVKGLFYAISHIQVEKVDDFMPASADLALFGLEEGKETLRIMVSSRAKKEDQKATAKETLLIGKHIDKANQYYARMLTDQGAFKVNDKYLATLFKVLKNPGELRSMDVLHLDTKTVDYVTLSPGGPEIKLFHPEGQGWLVQQAQGKIDKANDKAAQDFLDALIGKKQIQKFFDVPDSEGKKTDELYGLSTAEVSLFVAALEKPKKDEKKDDKKDVLKTEPKDEDPVVIKDSKPAAKLAFGKVEGDQVYVKSTLADGTVSRFTVPKALLDLVRPPDAKLDAQARSDTARLVFLKLALPELDTSARVRRFDLDRHGSPKLELELHHGQEWSIKGTDPTGPNALERFVVDVLIRKLIHMDPKKWVKKLDPKDDLEQWGLKNPAVTVTMLLKKFHPLWERKMTDLLTNAKLPVGAANAFASSWTPILSAQASLPWGAAANYLANEALDKGEIVTFKFGKETDQEKDKPGVFAQFSGSDLIFLVSPEIVKGLREFDPRDKKLALNFQHVVDASLASMAGLQATTGHGLTSFIGQFTSPLATGQVMSFDPAKVKAVTVAVRTPHELRTFTFQKSDKTWTKDPGLKDFNLDPDKVKQMIDELAKLKADRLASFGGPKADYKLSPLDATLRIDIYFTEGNPITYAVGSQFERNHYFAHSTSWPAVVFFVNATRIDPVLRGAGYFGKERMAGGP